MKKATAPLAPVTTRAEALDRIKTAMVEKKLTQAELADTADCHEKTIQNLLGGRSVRDQTCSMSAWCWASTSTDGDAAGKSVAVANGPLDEGERRRHVAPVYMGAYSRAAGRSLHRQLLDAYGGRLLARSIVAYRTDITWDPDWPSLCFRSATGPMHPTRTVAASIFRHRRRLIHLVSLTKGAMRMVVVSQLDRAGEMRGIITTLEQAAGHIHSGSDADRLRPARKLRSRSPWRHHAQKSGLRRV